MFAVHGALFAALKTDGPVAERATGAAISAWYAFVLLFVTVTIATAVTVPVRFNNFMAFPLGWLVPLFALAAIASTFRYLKREDVWGAFLSSTATIVGLMGILGVSLVPNMLPASNDAANSLTAFNASSSQLTLQIMLILVCIGLPLVVIYTYYVYRIFRGKVRLSEDTY
jgi:cytochrome d ubiquinol oxidase subunit II